MKWSTLIAAVLLAISAASAASFGSYPVDSAKETSNLETEFRMKLFNPGGTTAAVKFETDESGDYNVSFPENIRVEPAEVTENPSGSGWYHLGDGRYTKVREVSFRVDISRYRSSNSIEIPITVTASPVDPETGEASSKIVYIHDHRLKVDVVNSQPEDRDAEDEGDDGITWNIVDESEQKSSGENSSEKTAETGGNRSGAPESYKQEEEKPEDGGSGANTTTMILIIGIAATALYLRRAI